MIMDVLRWLSAAAVLREVSAVVLSRQQKQCNFLEYKDKKVIYKRRAAQPSPSGHLCAAVDGHAAWRWQVRFAVLFGLR